MKINLSCVISAAFIPNGIVTIIATEENIVAVFTTSTKYGTPSNPFEASVVSSMNKIPICDVPFGKYEKEQNNLSFALYFFDNIEIWTPIARPIKPIKIQNIAIIIILKLNNLTSINDPAIAKTTGIEYDIGRFNLGAIQLAWSVSFKNKFVAIPENIIVIKPSLAGKKKYPPETIKTNSKIKTRPKFFVFSDLSKSEGIKNLPIIKPFNNASNIEVPIEIETSETCSAIIERVEPPVSAPNIPKNTVVN